MTLQNKNLPRIAEFLKNDTLTHEEANYLESILDDFINDNNEDYDAAVHNRYSLGQGVIHLDNSLTDHEIVNAVRTAIRRSDGASFTVITTPIKIKATINKQTN